MLFLSSRYTVALRSEDLPGFDRAAYCAPLLFDRAREGVDFVTVAIGRRDAARLLQKASPIIQRCPLMSIDPCFMVTEWHFLLVLVKAKDATIAKIVLPRPGWRIDQQ
jgi:hypothetical protein